MREEILDVEEADDGIGLNDLTLDDFIADLLHFIQQNRAALEAAPLGIHAIVGQSAAASKDGPPEPVRRGAIFCLKRNGDPIARTPNRLWPYFLVYVRNDGSVRYTFRQARQCLALFQTLAAGRPDAVLALEDAFDQETAQGRHMEKYDSMLAAALRSIAGTFRDAELAGLSRDRGAVLTAKSQRQNPAEDFTLVTWLVITNVDARERDD